MPDPVSFIEKAKHSKWYLWLLNKVLARMIPFNLPHKFKILEISDTYIKTKLPYRRKNKNHLGGLHACALATLSEYTTGVLLLTGFSPKEYRLILKSLEIDYFYQGKMSAYATFRLNPDWIEENVLQPLKSEEAVVAPCEVKIHDKKGNHLTTARVYWQIKPWARVKTGRPKAA